MAAIKDFLVHHYRHFNAAVVIDAAQGYVDHLANGGQMLVTLAGAMSTAELGLSLAEMIRQGKVQAICSTGANLEEDVFNLVAHSHYKRVPNYRNLSDEEELQLLNSGMNRVTDTCIPEEEAMRRIERRMLTLWRKASQEGKRFFPYEYMYQLIDSGELEELYEIDPQDSWILAACERKLPIFVPGWEDSTLGNVFVAAAIRGDVEYGCVKSGLELMGELVDWYKENSVDESIGFFQIGGGIAGDFPICVVPLIQQDLHQDCRLWGY
ncbi:MAG TPA: deoxyhypusine synthase family protein, partial [Dehalococcoidia bacterium]|nr:deoxyhypusine synthase family protein [Dehalococcoidia bacterium]